jgi:hypothetical protein
LWYTLRWIRPRVKSAYVTYTTIGAKSTLSIKTSPIGLTCLYATHYIHVNLLRVSLIATLYTPVRNIIEDLLLLAASTYIDPPVLLPRIHCVYNARALQENETRIPYTLNASCAGYCDPTLENETRITHTLNVYCAQDIATRRQIRIPHTPKRTSCAGAL